MDRTVTVRALEAFEYEPEHRQIRAGEYFVVPAVQAAILARQRRISLSLTAPHTLTPEPDPEPEPPKRRRRQYTRRDVVPEP